MAILQPKRMEPVCPLGTTFLQLCPTTDKCTEDMRHLRTAERCSGGEKEILSLAAALMELEGSMAGSLPRWKSEGGSECTGVRDGLRADKGGGICMHRNTAL